MKSLLFFALAFAAPCMAKDSPTTPIVGADLRCDTANGGAIAIDWYQPRIWQTDPGLTYGIELSVVEFSRARCGLDITAKVELTYQAQKMTIDLQISQDEKTNEIAGTYKVEDESISMKCQLVDVPPPTTLPPPTTPPLPPTGGNISCSNTSGASTASKSYWII